MMRIDRKAKKPVIRSGEMGGAPRTARPDSARLVVSDSRVSRDDRGDGGAGCADERASPVRHSSAEAGKPVPVKRRELRAQIVDDERRRRLGAAAAPVMRTYHDGLQN